MQRTVRREQHANEICLVQSHHPGLGEGGKYHDKEEEHPLPDSEIP